MNSRFLSHDKRQEAAVILLTRRHSYASVDNQRTTFGCKASGFILNINTGEESRIR